jgi:hypothetical protein
MNYPTVSCKRHLLPNWASQSRPKPKGWSCNISIPLNCNIQQPTDTTGSFKHCNVIWVFCQSVTKEIRVTGHWTASQLIITEITDTFMKTSHRTGRQHYNVDILKFTIPTEILTAISVTDHLSVSSGTSCVSKLSSKMSATGTHYTFPFGSNKGVSFIRTWNTAYIENINCFLRKTKGFKHIMLELEFLATGITP